MGGVCGVAQTLSATSGWGTKWCIIQLPALPSWIRQWIQGKRLPYKLWSMFRVLAYLQANWPGIRRLAWHVFILWFTGSSLDGTGCVASPPRHVAQILYRHKYPRSLNTNFITYDEFLVSSFCKDKIVTWSQYKVFQIQIQEYNPFLSTAFRARIVAYIYTCQTQT